MKSRARVKERERHEGKPVSHCASASQTRNSIEVALHGGQTDNWPRLVKSEKVPAAMDVIRLLYIHLINERKLQSECAQ